MPVSREGSGVISRENSGLSRWVHPAPAVAWPPGACSSVPAWLCGWASSKCSFGAGRKLGLGLRLRLCKVFRGCILCVWDCGRSGVKWLPLLVVGHS